MAVEGEGGGAGVPAESKAYMTNADRREHLAWRGRYDAAVRTRWPFLQAGAERRPN